MKIQPLLFALVLLLCSCNTSKLLTKTAYTGTQNINETYVIVLSDDNTESCMNYYRRFLVDSLAYYGVSAKSVFNCCIDKKTRIKDEILERLPEPGKFKTVLTVVVTKSVIGHGTTSSRELQLDLLDFDKQEKAWSGKLSVSFDWFISDDNYRSVARKMLTATLKEMRNQKIISSNQFTEN